MKGIAKHTPAFATNKYGAQKWTPWPRVFFALVAASPLTSLAADAGNDALLGCAS